MGALLVVAGTVLIAIAFADLVNTLVTTSTSYARWWPTRLVWTTLYGSIRWVASRLKRGSTIRERLLAAFAPLLLVALLATWATLQVVGFGLVWAAVTGIDAITGLGDAVYYSGVVYFTVGFGEIVPAAVVPRAGALVEAFAGVATTALVIGYLPTLYAAYSARERQLMILDDGSGERITPTSLVMAWSPDADPAKLEARFATWERWVAEVHETHATLPLLRLFRSHDPHQHWITALGVVTDAALTAQFVLGAYDGHGYWLIRRATALFDDLSGFASDEQIEPYRTAHRERVAASDGEGLRIAWQRLRDHGFRMVPFETGLAHARLLRAEYAPQMELLIDYLEAPRGFWSPGAINVPLLSTTHPEMLDYEPDDT